MRCSSAFFVLNLLFTASVPYAATDAQSIPLIIKYTSQHLQETTLRAQIKQLTHLEVAELKPMANGAYRLILNVPAGLQMTEADAIKALRTNPQVRYVVQDRISYFKPVPEPKEDTQLVNILTHHSQWDEFARPAGIVLESKPGLKDGAWAYTTGQSSKPVVVAVLDTGIALNEGIVNNLVRDKEGAIWGWNFAENNNNLTDETQSYHGTHVAGTIAGYGEIMSGMGEELKILPVKIPAKNGMFYESAVINAIYWSVGGSVPGVPDNIHPAKVLNMSFGVDIGPGHEMDYCDEALQDAVDFARQKGAVLAVAAGNDNHLEHFNAPAVCQHTLKIASTGPEGLRAYYSNYGPSTSFAAPGGDKRYGLVGGILSTVNPGGGYHASGFDFYQGTSMATPHVAGVAGLIYAVSSKELNAEQVEQILYVTTHDFGQSRDENKSCVGKKPCGHGILDAEQAIKATLADFDVLFSAPQMSLKTAKQCENGGIEGNERLATSVATWTKLQGACDLADRYQHPFVTEEKGVIYAHYGLTQYQLNQSAFKECVVVGYDGVGCRY